MVNDMAKKTYTIEIGYHGTDNNYPWEVKKETIEPGVLNFKEDQYKTPAEALREAIRFLASSMKLNYPRPEDAEMFKNVIDWIKCAQCERNACDGCDNTVPVTKEVEVHGLLNGKEHTETVVLNQDPDQTVSIGDQKKPDEHVCVCEKCGADFIRKYQQCKKYCKNCWNTCSKFNDVECNGLKYRSGFGIIPQGS